MVNSCSYLTSYGSTKEAAIQYFSSSNTPEMVFQSQKNKWEDLAANLLMLWDTYQQHRC